MKLKNVYVIINECIGDSECDPAGVIGVYDDYQEASDAMEADAREFYESRIDECDRDEYPLEVGAGFVQFDYYGVLHTWKLETID